MQNDIYHQSRLCRAPNSEKVKMALWWSLESSRILWWNFACTLVLTRCSPRDCQMPFVIGRGFAEVQIQTCPSLDKLWSCLSPDSSRKMPTTLELFGIFWYVFAYTLKLTGSSPRDCKMTCIIGRGVVELQIRKKCKWHYLLNRVEYCDEIFMHIDIDKM